MRKGKHVSDERFGLYIGAFALVLALALLGGITTAHVQHERNAARLACQLYGEGC